MNSAIILAGGSGARTNLKTPKQFVKVNPKNCIVDYSIRAFKSVSKITEIILVCPKDWKMEFRLAGDKIESGLLETILDEPIHSDTSSQFIQVKQSLLKKAETNLGHYSDQD